MNTSEHGYGDRRRRRQHSAEFKARVVAACRRPGVSIAAVALEHRLHANLLRRWVVAFDAIEPLQRGGKLGAIHFQFAPWITSGGPLRRHVEHCVQMMEGRRLMAVEFRNASWWTDRNSDSTWRARQDSNPRPPGS